MIFGSCHFLFHQFTQRDEPYQIVTDMDALAAFSTAFIRSPDIDRFDQLMGRARRQFGHIRVLPDFLDEKFKILVLLFLCLDFLPYPCTAYLYDQQFVKFGQKKLIHPFALKELENKLVRF